MPVITGFRYGDEYKTQLDEWQSKTKTPNLKIQEDFGITPTAASKWRRGLMAPSVENCITLWEYTNLYVEPWEMRPKCRVCETLRRLFRETL